MKKILAYWIIILTIYGILLGWTRNYETLSFFYHLALLFLPLALIFSKRESFGSLGFKKGDVKQGIICLFCLFVALLGGIYFRAFLLDKTVSLVFNCSILFILMTVLAPISEEMFHRGLLQTKFEKTLGATKGILLAAVFFALIHVPKLLFAKEYISTSTPLPIVSHPIIALFSFFLMGVMFGYIYKETKSINYAIGAHILVNLTLVVFIY